jgi:hypothetical protein
LKGCVDFLHGMQRSVIHTSQDACGLFFLGMLLQFALAFFGHGVQILFGFSELVQIFFALLTQ